MPGFDIHRIARLEEQIASVAGRERDPALSDLEMLADLYLQADHVGPALEIIERLLTRPEARALPVERRVGLRIKCISCRLLQGDPQSALAQARELLAEESVIEPLSLRCKLHLQCGDALFRLGRIDEGLVSARRGLELADAAGELAPSAAALNLLGRLTYRRGDAAEARDLYEQALALYRRIGDDTGAAHVRNNLGLIHKNLCEWDAAAAHHQQALEIHKRSGHFGETLAPLINLGIVFQKSGDWKHAAQHFTEAQRVATQIGDELRTVNIAIGLGNVARLERRFEDSERLLTQARVQAHERGALREEVLAREFLAELDFDRGRYEEALTAYHEALRLAERVAPEGDLVVEIERRRAEVLLALGRLDAADSACQRASRLARQTDDRLEFAVAERVGGSIAWARGRAADAFVSWTMAATLLERVHERLELGKTYLELGRAESDPVQARRHLYRAAALFGPLSTPYWLERAEQQLNRTAAVESESSRAPGLPTLMGRRSRAPGLVACSQTMQQVEHLACRAGATELSVVITGETGTGKELVARTIHSLSSRSGKPFLAVNCGALRADLALSQLFGHRKGAFTGAHTDGVGLFEAAHGGTLFLDEVGELPLDVQVTLLRFLESGEYMRLGETHMRRADVRMIAATNRELRGADERLFRRDLLFRLNEVEIAVPALRERRDDIVPLARHFLAFYGGLGGPRLSSDAESVLLSHAWPGNVRELENVMKRLAALHVGDALVTPGSLMPFLSHEMGLAPVAALPTADGRAAILEAYAEARGNKSRAAELLGISRKTLYARLKRWDLQLP